MPTPACSTCCYGMSGPRRAHRRRAQAAMAGSAARHGQPEPDRRHRPRRPRPQHNLEVITAEKTSLTSLSKDTFAHGRRERTSKDWIPPPGLCQRTTSRKTPGRTTGLLGRVANNSETQPCEVAVLAWSVFGRHICLNPLSDPTASLQSYSLSLAGRRLGLTKQWLTMLPYPPDSASVRPDCSARNCCNAAIAGTEWSSRTSRHASEPCLDTLPELSLLPNASRRAA
jgi:hypothetical protein